MFNSDICTVNINTNGINKISQEDVFELYGDFLSGTTIYLTSTILSDTSYQTNFFSSKLKSDKK